MAICSSPITVKVKKIDKGFKVLIKDPPPSGSLKVYYLVVPTWKLLKTYSVTENTTELLIPVNLHTKYKFELYDDSGYLLYSKEVDAPDKGVVEITLYGWRGCHWRATIVEAPSKVKSGESFRLKARLFKTPDKPVGEGYSVVFYKKIGEKEQSIGKNVTDENGYAVITTSETLPKDKEKLDVEYYATYEHEKTYAESVIVTVVSTEAPTNVWEQFVYLVKKFLEFMGVEVTMEQADVIAKIIVVILGLSLILR